MRYWRCATRHDDSEGSHTHLARGVVKTETYDFSTTSMRFGFLAANQGYVVQPKVPRNSEL